MLPLIALEEHFAAKPNFATNRDHDFYKSAYSTFYEKLTSFGEARLNDMDIGKTTLQVVSYTPIHLTVDECRIGNIHLSEGVKSNPARFVGFACLPMSDVTEAVAELTHCVKDFKFVGALIPNHLHGEFYDDEKFWPIFERAQELDVPIYLHPTFPSDDLTVLQYTGNFSETASKQLGMYGLGWHSQVALHILRLFASGLFDRYPRLKIIVGHMGEMLPF